MKRSIKGITDVKHAIKANIWYEVFFFSVAGFLGFLVNASIVWLLTAITPYVIIVVR